MNQKLQDAVAIFNELGWNNATLENVLQLPLGTAEQKKAALSGLKNGEWGELVKTQNTTYQWQSYFEFEPAKLALFAIFVGVDARRAANIARNIENEMLVLALLGRGAKYVSDFIGFACISRRRMWEHSASIYGNAVVKLVDALNLDIPQNVEYMKDWAIYAAAAMGKNNGLRFGETQLPSIDIIKKRFIEHIAAGVALNVPATGQFGFVLPQGIKLGWISLEQGIDYIFLALDACVRPGDRKVWLAALDELSISDDELILRIPALIPLLSTGDSAAIERLAPLMVEKASDDLLSEIIPAAFLTSTQKAKKLVLKSALSRKRPENSKELAPWISALLDDKSRPVAAMAKRLMQKWQIDESEVISAEVHKIQELWQETPPIWQVQVFDMGYVTPEALTELAAKFTRQPCVIHDIAFEKFLAMANILALKDNKAVCDSLRGKGWEKNLPLLHLKKWVDNGGKPADVKYYATLPIGRDYAVINHLGKIPCLLSTPSKADLSVSAKDFAVRLLQYKKLGLPVLEDDLLLALTRFDIANTSKEDLQAIYNCALPIKKYDGEFLQTSASEAIRAYCENPIKEPTNVIKKNHFYSIDTENIMEMLPPCFSRFNVNQDVLWSVFPTWGDAVLKKICWKQYEINHEQGLFLRQVARRAAPLTPGAAINLIAAQRSVIQDAAEDSSLAVRQAWQRGLLRPGVPDASLLDWKSSPPSHIKALSFILDELAQMGMLSLVWPILDTLIQKCLNAPKLVVGTAELVQLIKAYIPEVQLAIEKGLANNTSFDLPGTRSLAEYGGNSAAVNAAKNATALLPKIKNVKAKPKIDVSQTMEIPFEELWKTFENQELPIIEDKVKIKVCSAYPAPKKLFFLFSLKLPDIDDTVFHVSKSYWRYDLESEGQCQAQKAGLEEMFFSIGKENEVWLHWDVDKEKMVVCQNRNWAQQKNGRLIGVQPTPLSISLLTIIVGLLAQDGDTAYFAPNLIKKFAESGQIGTNAIKMAAKTLLQNPIVSPAKLVRSLEKSSSLLSTLWPLLTEGVKAAGAMVLAGEKPPVWVNRLLDISLQYGPYLAKAAKHGLIPKEDAKWEGLSAIALSKAKSSSVEKAKKLIKILQRHSLIIM